MKLLDRSSLKKLRKDEVRELGRIYRRTASDLAIARAESRDPRLVNYLNSLVIRAHGRIYRADAQGGKRIRNYFARELPQTFRRTWRYTAFSFAIFASFAVFSFVATRYDPEFSELVGVSPAMREGVIETRTPWWESLNDKNQIGAAFIMQNNIRVTIYTFAYGALLGLGTVYYLAFNGANIAPVLALIVALRRRRLAQTIGATARLVADRTSAVAAIESPAADNRFAYAPAIAIGVVMAALSW